MTQADTRSPPSTGFSGLDGVVQRVLLGDNIVWQVDAIEDYRTFVTPFCATARAQGRRLIYFRFAQHDELVPPEMGAETHRLRPEVGFETFTAEIHRVIEKAGLEAFYVFDCLSDLAADWYSDLMLGNFFMVTCPYLYDLDTVTYFALLRDHHSVEAVSAIRQTTQLLLDVFRHESQLYVHPLKVDQRYSPTMYLPHVCEGDDFRPLTESAALSDLMVAVTERRLGSVSRMLDVWDRNVMQTPQVFEGLRDGSLPPQVAHEIFQRLLHMLVTREERVGRLAERYLDLADLLAIRKRMIGSGVIGGKAVGMLLARAILAHAEERWREKLEPHDSFYIGTDVFYTYLVRNGCWRVRRNQRNPDSFLEGAEEAQDRILSGTFPPSVMAQFVAMLEYFGQAPIIVRSSSLLEDGFGNAFTGKYESVFCPNQGSPEDRLEAFLSAVRTVYASSMSAEALQYRAHRGLLDSDEQMGILVQRVSGAVRGHLFYPQIAGVGLSYNPYVWSEYIDPQAGVLRLVFGLGTRAVDRSDDDYTRVVALNAPERRPEADFDEVADYAQHRVDVLDLQANRFDSQHIGAVVEACPEQSMDLFATARRAPGQAADAVGPESLVLTFDKLLSETSFVKDMQDLLRILRDAYRYPVDVEYTANFHGDDGGRINLVQCRPLQVREGGRIVPPPEGLRAEDVVLEAQGTVIGPSSFAPVQRVIYVVPDEYSKLPIRERYSVARLIGQLTHVEGNGPERPATMLIGPGRWGTSTPSLGVPVSFAEINVISVLCEIVVMHTNVVPDVSLGTHFFNDLVEANMLYLAVYPDKAGNSVNEAFLLGRGNRLESLLPEEARWADTVRVIDVPGNGEKRTLYVNANCLEQKVICYLADET